MKLRSAPLEDWLRDYYFQAEIDISSSGVQPYSMSELRAIAGISREEIDDLVFDDGYSLGAPEVRSAVAALEPGADPGKVMTTNGSGEAISLVMMALLRPGDEVIVVAPGYHLLVEYAIALGCTTKVWRLAEERGWQASLDELAALVTPQTRAIIVNFPQNPTGSTIGRAEMDALIALAGRVGAYVLWDAAFARLVYDGDPLPDISTRYERGIGFGTFSKAFGLPGLRFGWCLAPPEVLEDCVRIRDYSTLHVSPLVELLALRVLRNADAFVEPRLKQAAINREMVKQWAERHGDLLSLSLPAAGVAAFPRLLELDDTWDFCQELFQRHGVLVIPGACFDCPGHIRLGFGGPTDQLAQGLDRLAGALASWRR
ncbi:capreomycidine synthase [Nonomuraea guangzhouensis]|uniref:Capreomycidine synthase n=1 Tax=Nonomuraea guangzhouensis TaxID=1291555 RepID=A0ABW4FZ41_9ACTN|nr:capreomycidine synthase [Nonomuraea guangzhouensis]